jgi:hypothetical protein
MKQGCLQIIQQHTIAQHYLTLQLIIILPCYDVKRQALPPTHISNLPPPSSSKGKRGRPAIPIQACEAGLVKVGSSIFRKNVLRLPGSSILVHSLLSLRSGSSGQVCHHILRCRNLSSDLFSAAAPVRSAFELRSLTSTVQELGDRQGADRRAERCFSERAGQGVQCN